ncbi:MAG: SRPBCC domain-containing protein [Alphaproteobacteria bacterium]|nr:SRPBCC domain-containing protein [Alphaproteobacteria bacterium]
MGGARRQVTLERTYQATLEELWALWTTKDGIEAWWGPGGFVVVVHSLDVQPGGELIYTMAAKDPEMIAFMESSGQPTSSLHRATYTEVTPPRRLAWHHLVDFIPDTGTYQVSHLVELHPDPGGVRMVLTFDAMHDDLWTQRATMGWQQELDRIQDALVAGRPQAPASNSTVRPSGSRV